MTNAKNYDSEFCGRVPVHNINVIQPYGYLMVLDINTLLIVQVSENLQEVFGTIPEKIVNTYLYNHILQEEAGDLQNKLKEGISHTIPAAITINSQQLLALVHPRKEYLVVELERTPVDEPSFTSVYREVKYAMAAITQANTPAQIAQVAMNEIRRLMGFDSVLMYRFDEDWNGSVIAQAREEDMPDYMGLKFPASDIPKQVRELYLKHPYRLIPQRSYTAVKLFPIINPLTQTFTDLSAANLRGVAPVHLEYMKNMGLEASMSIRVIVNDALWGLISCHHRSAYIPAFELRSVLELLSSVVSDKIAAVLNKEEYDSLARLNEIRAKLIDYIYAGNDWVQAVTRQSINLLHLLNADGATVVYKGKMMSLGTVPDIDDIENLVYWLQAKKINRVYSVTNLSSINDYALNYAGIGSGILVVPINPDAGDFIIGFRKEVIRDVNWGGNPDEALVFEADNKNYHPRNSFGLWKQVVKNTSLPWSPAELKVAESFRYYVFEYMFKKSASAS